MPRRSEHVPGQLPVGLAVPEQATGSAAAASLPRLDLVPEWRDQPRLWGPSLHPMCSYLAMFPATLPHAFIARYTRPGDVVLDPFAGRGTTPLQACAEGRVGVGNDLNPFAHLLTAAKLDPPRRHEAEARVQRLRIDWSLEQQGWRRIAADARQSPGDGVHPVPGPHGGDPAPLPPEVALAYDTETLAQLLFARSTLRLDDRVDRFLLAALSGILHGRSRHYLSDMMPNSFAMAPGYVRAFVSRTGFHPAARDVWVSLLLKLRRLYRDGSSAAPGIALLGDARDAGPRAAAALRARSLPDRVRLVVTSPPYLRVVRYGYYNWLRFWFLGLDPAEVDARLEASSGRERYAAFLRDVLEGLRPVLAADAVVALVIGDVERDRGKRIEHGRDLAEAVWQQAAEPLGYRLAGVAVDEVPSARKLTRVWGDEAGRATRTERILVLSPTEMGRRRAVASAGVPISWEWPPPTGRVHPETAPRRADRREPVRPAAILAGDASDVPPGRPRSDGRHRPDEEPGSRPDDLAPAELHPAAAGAPVHP